MFKSVIKRKSCSCVKLNHAHIICMKDIVVNVSQNTLNFENCRVSLKDFLVEYVKNI